jgi:hypothetical protein
MDLARSCIGRKRSICIPFYLLRSDKLLPLLPASKSGQFERCSLNTVEYRAPFESVLNKSTTAQPESWPRKNLVRKKGNEMVKAQTTGERISKQ